jgi:ribosomal silencing factor RsfS
MNLYVYSTFKWIIFDVLNIVINFIEIQMLRNFDKIEKIYVSLKKQENYYLQIPKISVSTL